MNTRRPALGQPWTPYTRNLTNQNSTIAASQTQWRVPPAPTPDPEVKRVGKSATVAKWAALAALVLAAFAAGRAGR